MPVDSPPLTITPTPRLARAEARRFALANAARGALAWRRARILAFPAWLAELRSDYFLAGDDDRVPISASQAEWLWRSVIDREVFIGEPAVASLAARAWRLIHEYDLDRPEQWPALLLSEDSGRFRQWAARYRALCAERGLVDEWVFAAELPELIGSGALVVPATMRLAGFDLPVTPLLRLILDAMAAAGCAIARDGAVAGDVEGLDVVACTTPDEELLAAARWARARLESEPDQAIAVVVPDLEGRVERVESLFRQVFDPPGFELDPAGDPAWHVSLGLPLARWPLVTDALAVLALNPYRIGQPQAARLLRSPFLAGWPAEHAARAQAVAQLARFGDYEVSPNELAARLQRAGAEQLAGGLRQWRRLYREQRGRALPATWVGRFQALLDTVGFARGRALDSREFQALARWHELLESFSALDLVAERPLSRRQALARLTELAGNTVFRERNPGAPVEVLGVAEALGSRFDAMWITTLHGEQWPRPARRDPFVPGPVQAEVPAATGAGCLRQARLELRSLLAAAETRRGSFARGGDEVALELTPLLPGARLRDNEQPGPAESAPMTHLDDDSQAPALEATTAAGGTSVLRNQSDCPFRAFAERRLRAVDVTPPRPGLDVAARGTLMHAALERFWRDLSGLDALRALAPDALDQRIAAAVEAAVSGYVADHRFAMSEATQALERDCLCRNMHRWLAVEAGREDFTVLGLETEVELDFGDLVLTGKIDRVDRLPGGGRVLIDYKTGAASRGGWFPEARLADPQLPAYAVCADPPPAAIAFARIRPDELCFDGLAGDETGMPGVEVVGRVKRGRLSELESWPGLLHDWRVHLEALAADFRTGHAAVDPRRNDVCNRCHLHALCRIHERVSFIAEAGDE